MDDDGEVRGEIERLATMAGLRNVPYVVVDPTTASTGAAVFGSTSRPVLCLHGGLLIRRRTDLGRFGTVLLHELAHIRNGDITLTCATVAVWRVFLSLVLLPCLAWYAMRSWRAHPDPDQRRAASADPAALFGLAGAGQRGGRHRPVARDRLRCAHLEPDSLRHTRETVVGARDGGW